MIIRNSKNSSLVNLDKVTQIYPSISEKNNVFDLYFIFEAINGESCNEVQWSFNSRDEIEQILCSLDITQV